MFRENQMQKAIAVAVTLLLMVGSLTVLLPFAALPVAGDAPFSVNIKVNTEPITSDQNEVDMAVDAAGRIYVVWEDNRNTDLDIFFTNSTDSGATWTDPNKQINTGGTGTVQAAPAIAAYGTGNLFVAWEDMQGGDFDIYFANSTDGGITWSSSMIVNTDASGFAQSAPDLAADSSGNVYAVWQDYRSTTDFDIYFAKSTDGGATWTDPNVRVNTDATTTAQRNPVIAVDSFNNIYVAWQDLVSGNYDINVSKSTDGGVSWSDPAFTVNTDLTTQHQRDPQIAVDSMDNIYLVWEDRRSGDYDIYIANSTDGGASWSDPNVRVSTDTLNTSQENPTIAVGTSGVISVAWHDLRLGDNDIYFSNSTDGGATWAFPDIRVNDDPAGKTQMNPAIVAYSSDSIYAAWEDRRNDNYDVFFASIQPPPLPPTVDYIILTDTPDGTPLTLVDLSVGEAIGVYASGYNITGATYVGPVDVDWTQSPLLGSFTNVSGNTTVFNAGFTAGIVDIYGNSTINPAWADNFTVNIISPTVDYIDITDIPDGTPLSGGSVLVNFIEWGNCSMYNNTIGYLGTVAANWTAEGIGGAIPSVGAPSAVFTFVNVGPNPGTVWFNTSFDVYTDSVMYTVTTWSVDSINITYTPNGIPLAGGPVPVGFIEWGNCSAYNITAGYIGTVSAEWTVEGGGASLLEATPNILNGIDVGIVSDTVWFNASYNGRTDSVQYTVNPPTIDYIDITDVPDGLSLSGGIVPVSFVEWGNCSAYNDTSGYLALANADWSAEGGTSSLLGATPAVLNGIDVGNTVGDVWLNASFGPFTDSVLYNVITPTVDYIMITDVPDGIALGGGIVAAGFTQWGNCSAYNISSGYISTVSADWTADGGNSVLIGPATGIASGIDVGTTIGEVWLNATYNTHTDSVLYVVSPPTVDYIEITDVPDGTQLAGGLVPVGFSEWGNCSAYNTTSGFIQVVSGNWTTDGGSSSLLGSTPDVMNGIYVGLIEGPVWLNVTYDIYQVSVPYNVMVPTIDYIDITDLPDGISLAGGIVPLGFMEWGNCSAYNDTSGYIDLVGADWTAVGGGALLLGVTPANFNGIDVGLTLGMVWFNATFGLLNDSVVYSVADLTVDYIDITDTPGGTPLSGGLVSAGLIEFGNCSLYNLTAGYIGTVSANWTVEGGSSTLIGTAQGVMSGLNVGNTGAIVWFNATYGAFTDSVAYTVIPPTVDYIIIVNTQNAGTAVIPDQIVDVGYTINGYAAAFNYSLGYFADVSVDWSVDAVGSTAPASGINSTFDAGVMGGVATWTADDGAGHNDTVVFTVRAPTVDYIQIEDEAGGAGSVVDTVSYPVDDFDQYYCGAYNNTIGYIWEVPASWEVTGGIGTVFPTTDTFTQFNATTPGTGQVTATYNNMTYATGTITVGEPTVDYIVLTVTPDGTPLTLVNLSVGEAIGVYASGYNITGATYVGLVDVDWSQSPSLGSLTNLSGNTNVFTAGFSAGVADINGTSLLNPVWADNFTVNIISPTVDYIEITDVPDGTPLSGGSVPVGFSEWGNCSLYNNTAGYIGTGNAFWTATGGTLELLGGVPLTMNGIHVGTVAGAVTFTATYNLLSDSVIYTVLDPEVDYIIIRDAAGGSGNVVDSATFTVGDSTTFYAAGYNDTSGFVEDIAGAVWGVTGGIGSATTPGASTTFSATAAGIGRISATSGGISYESGDITVEPEVTISQPGQPQIESKGEDFIEISWPANSESNLGGYRVYRRLSPNDDWTLLDSVGADTTSYKDEGLESGTTYYYSVSAIDDAIPPNESPRSVSVSTTTDEVVDGETPWMMFLAIIIIIIILVLLVLILRKKKPKEEGMPEERPEPEEEEPSEEPEEEPMEDMPVEEYESEDTAVDETEATHEGEAGYETGEESGTTEDSDSISEEGSGEIQEDIELEEEPGDEQLGDDERRDEL